MSALTIRNLDERTQQALRERAAEHGVSVEQEAGEVLRSAILGEQSSSQKVWRLKASREEILALGRKPERPFDLKAVCDQMWDEGLL
ncbi:hypothetical protein [Mesorhizobium sp. KR2-14]|uniref:FitA-like ribbon-helix-helix domain-containing protein n=1 Tax=Mesorhizobium sp. KR2-14 TaxID=3156610 RepID=UPI0032B447DB